MSDNTSTAKQIAEEFGCSIATVNNKAGGLGFKLKGRSAADHAKLLDALKDVKPRKPGAKKVKKVKKVKKTKAKIKSVGAVGNLEFAGNVDAYFKQARALISEIKKRLTELEKEKTALEAKLQALQLLHPPKK